MRAWNSHASLVSAIGLPYFINNWHTDVAVTFSLIPFLAAGSPWQGGCRPCIIHVIPTLGRPCRLIPPTNSAFCDTSTLRRCSNWIRIESRYAISMFTHVKPHDSHVYFEIGGPCLLNKANNLIYTSIATNYNNFFKLPQIFSWTQGIKFASMPWRIYIYIYVLWHQCSFRDPSKKIVNVLIYNIPEIRDR